MALIMNKIGRDMSSSSSSDQMLLASTPDCSRQLLVCSRSADGHIVIKRPEKCSTGVVAILCMCLLGLFVILLSLFLLDPHLHRPAASPAEPAPSLPVVDEFSLKVIILEQNTAGRLEENIVDHNVSATMASEWSPARGTDERHLGNGSLCWEVEQRFDCMPSAGASQEACEARGCCWRPPEEQIPGGRPRRKKGPQHLGVPYCFYPFTYPAYELVDYAGTASGFTGLLRRDTAAFQRYPVPIEWLRLTVEYQDVGRLRVKLTDANSSRYEVPLPPLADTPQSRKPANPLYLFNVTQRPFSFRVSRRDNGRLLFDTSAGSFSFYDQFIELSSFLPTRFVYGLGEHTDRLVHSVDYTRLTFFASDVQPGPNLPLYGGHPFYLALEGDGRAHGVFLRNSNAMDVILTPAPAITYRTVGGVIDLYVFLGPSPKEVLQQYMQLVGRPALPPYWALGFHLCRYGYGSLNRTREVMQRNIDAGIPLDVQWNDIDYMDKSRDFSYDHDKFHDLPAFVNQLHEAGMHYVIITDPGISSVETAGTYAPYDDGVAMNVFIKNASGGLLRGRVWTGDMTVFPDFTHPNATQYWTQQIAAFHQEVPFDGLWIDMNEPSNFVDGSVDGCPASSLEDPPYLPHVIHDTLKAKTICMTAKQHLGAHYDLHNLYGISETMATRSALLAVKPQTRPFIISRSSFSGQGGFSGHWTGDVPSTWEAMQRSIPAILNFNMFGVPLVGVDICGFNGNTTAELCQRWQQLGAFYPFARNHNSLGQTDQDPAAFPPEVVRSSREALQIRYRLLPYYYSLFFRAALNGATVVRPLFVQFPTDQATYEVDWQFMVGSGLLVSPVLTQGGTEVLAYFPAGRWYDFYTGEPVVSGGESVRLEAPLDKIQLHVWGGCIIPTQSPLATTTATRTQPFHLLVGLNGNGSALGELYWDDGLAVDALEAGVYSLIQFQLKQDVLQSKVLRAGFGPLPLLDGMTVFGMRARPRALRVHDEALDFLFDERHSVLLVKGLEMDLLTVFKMRFVF